MADTEGKETGIGLVASTGHRGSLIVVIIFISSRRVRIPFGQCILVVVGHVTVVQ